MSSLTPNAGQIFTCKHLMRVKSAIECVFCHRDELAQEVSTLRNELTAARLENANYEDEIVAQIAITRKREAEIERLNQRCQTMGWSLYPHSDPPREAVAGDIGWPT